MGPPCPQPGPIPDTPDPEQQPLAAPEPAPQIALQHPAAPDPALPHPAAPHPALQHSAGPGPALQHPAAPDPALQHPAGREAQLEARAEDMRDPVIKGVEIALIRYNPQITEMEMRTQPDWRQRRSEGEKDVKERDGEE